MLYYVHSVSPAFCLLFGQVLDRKTTAVRSKRLTALCSCKICASVHAGQSICLSQASNHLANYFDISIHSELGQQKMYV